jgi:hypothetical protein
VAKLWRGLGGRELPGARQLTHPGPAASVHRRNGAIAAIFGADPELIPPPSTGGTAAGPPHLGLADAARAAAGAAFYLAEAQWEELLRIAPPIDPDLLPDPEMDLVLGPPAFKWTPQLQRRFKAFITRKLDQLARTRQMYLALFARREPPFDVAAAARIGQLYEAFDDDVANDRLDGKAAAAFERCLDLGAGRERYDEWFLLCEHQLTVLKPTEFPKLNEHVPEFGNAESAIAPIPLIPRL